MNTFRSAQVIRTVRGTPTTEGAGVKLTRVMGTEALPDLDPFLMLDEFDAYHDGGPRAGFPAHPHRGFETVTYLLDGQVHHKDNHGNEGLLKAGGVQWMTAGRGVVHEEIPEPIIGRTRGFQLWVNLPASLKMTAPNYQEFDAGDIPQVEAAAGVTVKVIAGQVGAATGVIAQPATDPLYLDVELAAGSRWHYTLPEGHNAFTHVFEGNVTVGEGATARVVNAQELAVLGGGVEVTLTAGAKGGRLILVAGRPLGEPVARYGPFVMNTREELMRAFSDYESGRF